MRIKQERPNKFYFFTTGLMQHNQTSGHVANIRGGKDYKMPIRKINSNNSQVKASYNSFYEIGDHLK